MVSLSLCKFNSLSGQLPFQHRMINEKEGKMKKKGKLLKKLFELRLCFCIFDLNQDKKKTSEIVIVWKWKIRWMNEEGGVSAPVHILTVNLENCDFSQKKMNFVKVVRFWMHLLNF